MCDPAASANFPVNAEALLLSVVRSPPAAKVSVPFPVASVALVFAVLRRLSEAIVSLVPSRRRVLPAATVAAELLLNEPLAWS